MKKSSKKPAPATAAQTRLLPPGWLRSLGIYGYDAVEDVILASLVTADPLLLIGKAGTGKTFLLNSLSEALQLEHRHYNASLIAFDDLVGFPFPVNDGESIRYIQTPATIWQAESLLIDEISRCKAEHQNRLFSLVHERRIQGLELPRLRYRWAAMNPCEESAGDDFYEGSVALDQALADRFAFVLEVPDWVSLDEADRRLVADARGVDQPSVDRVGLAAAVARGRTLFAGAADSLHEAALTYASLVAGQLLQPGVRLSPRRVRLLSRNLVALTLVTEGVPRKETFLTALRASLPQLGWGVRVADAVVRGAHGAAWDLLGQGNDERWLAVLLQEPEVAQRCALLLAGAPSPDMASLAIRQSLVQLPKPEAAVFALALFPVAQHRQAQFGIEGVSALAEAVAPVLEVQGEVTFKLGLGSPPQLNPHLMMAECAALLESLPPRRKERARQLLYHCLAADYPLKDPAALEDSLDRAVRLVETFTGGAA